MSTVLTKFHSNLLNRLPPISTGIPFLALHGLVAALLTMIHVETIKLSTKKTTFQLPQNFSNAKLKVSLHAANAAIVYLNGVEIGRQKQGSIIPNFQDAPETFSTNSPFQPGTNVLEFAVTDYGSSSGLNYQAKFNYEHICDVEIDVKPGNPNNPVNLNSNGVIPVAISAVPALKCIISIF